MDKISKKNFKKIVGEEVLNRIIDEIGDFSSVMEYTNFYSAGNFISNRFVAQIYKSKKIYNNVYNSFLKIRESPIVEVTLKTPVKKGKLITKNINYANYMGKIKYFISDINVAIFESYQPTNYEYDDFTDFMRENNDYILWRYLIIREGLKKINININTIDDYFGIQGFKPIFVSFADLEIVDDPKDIKIRYTLAEFVVEKMRKMNPDFSETLNQLDSKIEFNKIKSLSMKNLKNQYYYDDIRQDLKIINDIKIFNPCSDIEIKNFSINNLNSNLLSNILNENYNNYNKMSAVSCLIKASLQSISKSNSPSVKIQDWLLNIKNIAEGVQGNVYFANLFSDIVPISFKLSKEEKISTSSVEQYFDFRKEFFKSYRAINTLRQFVPTFMYTFDMFSCYAELDPNGGKRDGNLIDLKMNTICEDKTPKQPFVISEKISGKTLKNFINDGDMNDKLFISIFQQILLSLEVAQSRIGFSHYDLHGGNLILRPVPDGYTYSVLLNNNKITVTDPKFIPVFIDFGFACCDIQGEKYGKFGYEKHQIFNFLIPCNDYIKVLLSIFYYNVKILNVNVCDKILNICNSKIMGHDLISSEQKLKDTMIEDTMLLKFMADGKIASITPLELLKNIQTEIGCPEISIELRKEFEIENYSIPNKVINDLYKGQNNDISSEIIENNRIDEFSFINTLYSLRNIQEYCKDNNDRNLTDYSNEIKKYLEDKKNSLINQDKENLELALNLNLPRESELLNESNFLFSLNIFELDPKVFYNIRNAKLMCEEFKEMSEFVNLFYKIQELKINEFSNWVNKFIISDNYKYYVRYVSLYSKLERWCETLSNSLVMEK